MTFRSNREQRGNRDRILAGFVRPGYNNNNDNNDKISRREGSFASIATRYQVLTRRNFASNSAICQQGLIIDRALQLIRVRVDLRDRIEPEFQKIRTRFPLSLKFCDLILIRREEVSSFLVRFFFHSILPCREQFLTRIARIRRPLEYNFFLNYTWRKFSDTITVELNRQRRTAQRKVKRCRIKSKRASNCAIKRPNEQSTGRNNLNLLNHGNWFLWCNVIGAMRQDFSCGG